MRRQASRRLQHLSCRPAFGSSPNLQVGADVKAPVGPPCVGQVTYVWEGTSRRTPSARPRRTGILPCRRAGGQEERAVAFSLDSSFHTLACCCSTHTGAGPGGGGAGRGRGRPGGRQQQAGAGARDLLRDHHSLGGPAKAAEPPIRGAGASGGGHARRQLRTDGGVPPLPLSSDQATFLMLSPVPGLLDAVRRATWG